MSTLYVDTINEKTSGNGIIIPGHVLQVVNNEYTARTSINSTSWTEVTGLTTSITPLSSSSKVLIQASITYSAFGHGGLRVYRSVGGTDTVLTIGDASGSRSREAIHAYRTTTYNTAYDADSASITILDTPATASAVSYKIYAATPHSASYYLVVNGQYSDADANYTGATISTMTLMEIGG